MYNQSVRTIVVGAFLSLSPHCVTILTSGMQPRDREHIQLKTWQMSAERAEI